MEGFRAFVSARRSTKSSTAMTEEFPYNTKADTVVLCSEKQMAVRALIESGMIPQQSATLCMEGTTENTTFRTEKDDDIIGLGDAVVNEDTCVKSCGVSDVVANNTPYGTNVLPPTCDNHLETMSYLADRPHVAVNEFICPVCSDQFCHTSTFIEHCEAQHPIETRNHAKFAPVLQLQPSELSYGFKWSYSHLPTFPLRIAAPIKCCMPEAISIPQKESSGCTRSLTREFTMHRNEFHSHSSQDAKLMDIVHKLLYGGPLPSSPNDVVRKQYEKSLVLWVEKSSQVYCGQCYQKWRFMQTKHQCRTCGQLICEACRVVPNTDELVRLDVLYRWSKVN